MIEIWRDIIGFESLYQVSSLGNIKSLSRFVENGGKRDFIQGQLLILKTKNQSGYLQVTLSKGSKKFSRRVHRLVALSFLENPNNYSQVNHLDGVKTNNIVTNLEWCTGSRNTKHAYDLGLIRSPIGLNNSQVKLSEDDVRSIFNRAILRTESQKSIASDFNISRQTVSAIKTGKIWKHLTDKISFYNRS